MVIDFKKETLVKFEHFYFDINLGKCHQYLIFEDEKEIGSFYFTNETSFAKIGDTPFLITLTKTTFKVAIYALTNLKTNQIIGKFEISNWPLGKTLKSTIEINSYSPFDWGALETKSVFNAIYSKTISKFSGRLVNDVSYLTFRWDYLNLNKAIYRIEDLPVAGQVHLADNENRLLIIVGLFMCEKEVEKKITEV